MFPLLPRGALWYLKLTFVTKGPPLALTFGLANSQYLVVAKEGCTPCCSVLSRTEGCPYPTLPTCFWKNGKEPPGVHKRQSKETIVEVLGLAKHGSEPGSSAHYLSRKTSEVGVRGEGQSRPSLCIQAPALPQFIYLSHHITPSPSRGSPALPLWGV